MYIIEIWIERRRIYEGWGNVSSVILMSKSRRMIVDFVLFCIVFFNIRRIEIVVVIYWMRVVDVYDDVRFVYFVVFFF